MNIIIIIIKSFLLWLQSGYYNTKCVIIDSTTTTMARTVTHTLYSTFNNNNNNENVFYYTRPSVSYMWERLYSLGRNKGVRILVYYNYDAKGSLMTTTSTQQQLLLRIKSNSSPEPFWIPSAWSLMYPPRLRLC